MFPSIIAIWTIHLQCEFHGLPKYPGSFDNNHIITFRNVEIFRNYFLKEKHF
jgi:hypothetical protein